MDKSTIAKELLGLAKKLTAEWKPVRQDVDIRMRNKELKTSLTTYAPALSKELKAKMAKSLQQQGFDVDARDLTREWSQYLAFLAPETNNNKYHYYAVYSFGGPNGADLYVAANCSGRIGIIERAYDLTKKYQRGPASSLALGVDAAEKHLKTKIRKGYVKVPMTRG